MATVAELKPDIIGITESWTNDMIFDCELDFEGYVLFRKDRPTINRGGGVLLYVKAEFNPIEFHAKTEYLEHVWCKIKGVEGDELYIGVCYRSNNDEIVGIENHSLLRNLLTEVSNKRILVMGDFNYAGLKWNNNIEEAVSSSVEGRLFVDCLEDNFLRQHVKQPTRGNNILDLIISSEPDLVSNVNIMDSLSTSDHIMILCDVHMAATNNLRKGTRFDIIKLIIMVLRKSSVILTGMAYW